MSAPMGIGTDSNGNSFWLIEEKEHTWKHIKSLSVVTIGGHLYFVQETAWDKSLCSATHKTFQNYDYEIHLNAYGLNTKIKLSKLLNEGHRIRAFSYETAADFEA